jgi:glyoxylase I family protein
MNLGLHCFADHSAGAFSARRPGLDHVAFSCADREDLQRWVDRLDSLGVTRGDVLAEPYGSGLAFSDPDGIALELFVSARNS